MHEDFVGIDVDDEGLVRRAAGYVPRNAGNVAVGEGIRDGRHVRRRGAVVVDIDGPSVLPHGVADDGVPETTAHGENSITATTRECENIQLSLVATAYQVVARAVGQRDRRPVVAPIQSRSGVGADAVTLDDVTRRCNTVDLDAVLTVVGDEVTGTGRAATDDVVGRILYEDSVIDVADVGESIDADTDVVPPNGITRRAVDEDSMTIDIADDVSFRGCRPADDGIRRAALESDAIVAYLEAGTACHSRLVGSDIVAGDDRAVRAIHLYGVAADRGEDVIPDDVPIAGYVESRRVWSS